MSSLSLSGRTVIVTGAARGLGRAMTLALLRAGANVCGVDFDAKDAQFISLRDEAGDAAPRLAAIGGDITDVAACARIVDNAAQAFGAVHGLINNAGIGMQGFGAVLLGDKPKFYEIDPAAWRKVFETNVNGAFLMAREAVRFFIAQQHGKIVNVTTSFRTMQTVGFSPYGPTKAALEAASVIWAKDLADTGVTVNVLLPGGAANTRMIPDGEVPDRSKLVQPETMGPPAVWLMSQQSDGVSGRRFIASQWNAELPGDEAAKQAGAPAGW